MQKKRILFAVLSVLFFAVGVFVFGNKNTAATAGKTGLRVVSTTGMIHDAVEHIGGELIQADGLMGPGVDPHLYKATEGDLRKLAGADVIFYNGLHLEGRMGDIMVKLANKRRVVAVTESIPEDLLMSPPEFAGLHDPHVWFDPTLWQLAVNKIIETLVEADPENAATYQQRGTNYIAAISTLHQKNIQKISVLPIQDRVLVTAHDAFGYFGRAYQFKVHALQGMSTETEAGTKDVQNLASLVIDLKVPAIFIESAIPERHIKAVQAATNSKGWPVKLGGELYADALGTAGGPTATYIGMFTANIDTVVKALSEKNDRK